MRALAPASLLWLLAQEGRVLWRGSLLVRTRRHVLLPVVIIGLAVQTVAFLLARAILHHPLPRPQMILAANLNLFFLGFLMLSRAITAAIDVLYARGDVDFLLAAPVPPGRVLAARMLGVAVSVAAPWLLLGGALANAFLLLGQFWALALYPMLAALGLIAAAAAFAVAVALAGWMPPARARRLGHLASLLVGLLIFALGQAPRFIAPATMARLWGAMTPGPGSTSSEGGGLFWLPSRAMLGAPLPLLACLAFSLLAFTLVWIGLGARFAAGAIAAAAHRPTNLTATTDRSRFPASPRTAAFIQASLLLRRFPGLATQIVYRSLTLVPVLIILAGRVTFGASPGVVAPLLVFLSGQLALFFISVIAASDQAPDLAASSPMPPATLRHAHRAVAATAVLLVLAVPLAVLVCRDPHLLPFVLPGLAAALLANLTLGGHWPIPVTRADFGKSRPAATFSLILGAVLNSLIAATVWLAFALTSR